MTRLETLLLKVVRDGIHCDYASVYALPPFTPESEAIVFVRVWISQDVDDSYRHFLDFNEIQNMFERYWDGTMTDEEVVHKIIQEIEFYRA